MRQILTLGTIILSFALVACGDEDDAQTWLADAQPNREKSAIEPADRCYRVPFCDPGAVGYYEDIFGDADRCYYYGHLYAWFAAPNCPSHSVLVTRPGEDVCRLNTCVEADS